MQLIQNIHTLAQICNSCFVSYDCVMEGILLSCAKVTIGISAGG